MKLFAFILLIASFNYLAFAADDKNYPPANTTQILRNQTAFKYNDYINVEFYSQTFFQSTNTTVTKKSSFYPKIDNFSRLVMNGSWDLIGQNTTYVWLVVHYNGTNRTSTKKRVTKDNRMVSLFEAQIALLRGVPQSVTWANQKKNNQTLVDTCQECNTTDCIDGFCGVAISKFNCTKNPRGCDVRCYVGFVGDDKEKRKCTSIESLPSSYNLYSWGPAYLVASGIFSDFIYGIKNQ